MNNCLDAFENFEFDIDLLTENTSKNKEIPTLELPEKKQQKHQQQQLQQNQQHQLSGVDNDKEKHQLELQLMLEDILFNNKNNNSSNSTTSCKTYNTFYNNINTTSINDNTFNNNMNNMASTCDLSSEWEVFKVAPNSVINEDILTPDDIYENFSPSSIELSNSEYAVDINCMTNEPSLNDCFLNSQPNDIMFTSYGQSSSMSSSQNLMNEISKAEPHIQSICPDSSYSVSPTTSAIAMESGVCDISEDVQYDCTSQYIMEDLIEECKENKTFNNPLKRHSSQTSKHMKEKRLKLRLDTKPCKENIQLQQSEISTPNVINIIDEVRNHENIHIHTYIHIHFFKFRIFKTNLLIFKYFRFQTNL